MKQEDSHLEKNSIDNIIRQFFLLFNNTAKQVPNLDAIYQLCIPETMIIKKMGNDQVVYTLESFIAPRKIILTDGTLTDFQEYEISSETLVFNNIAQRHCRYEKNGQMKGVPFNDQGTKLFHLIKTKDGWRITSLVWEDGQ